MAREGPCTEGTTKASAPWGALGRDQRRRSQMCAQMFGASGSAAGAPGRGGRLHPAAAPPPSPDPDVGGTKRQRLGAPSSPDPDVGPLPAPDPRKDAGADGPHLAGSRGWGGAPLHLSPHREVRRQPDVAADGPGPDVGGPDNGAWLLAVDSDTDAEGEEPHPDVAAPPGGRPAVGPPPPWVPAAGGGQRYRCGGGGGRSPSRCWPPRRASCEGRAPSWGERYRCGGGRLRSRCGARDPPPAWAKAPGRALGGERYRCGGGWGEPRCWLCRTPDVAQGARLGGGDAQARCWGAPRAVSPPSSDTDGGEVAPTPDVRELRSRIRFWTLAHPDVASSGAETAPNSWKRAPESRSGVGRIPSRDDGSPDPDVVAPSPDVRAPNPDVAAPSPDARAPNPDVAAPSPDVRAPNPDVAIRSPDVEALNADVATQSPDVEAPNPDVEAPNPDVVTPSPDVKAPNPDVATPNPDMATRSPGVNALNPGAVTPNPDVATPKPDAKVPNPDAVTPSPDVRAPNLDVEAPNSAVVTPGPDMKAPNPDVEAPDPDVVTPGPDVVTPGPDMKAPNPDVATRSPGVTALNPDVVIPDPDVVAPNPDVNVPDPDVVAPNPDVATPNPDVTVPDPDVATPNPDVVTPDPDVAAPNPDVPVPDPDVAPPSPPPAAPNPDVGAQGHNGKTPAPIPAVPMDASTPKSPHLDSCSGGADGTESDSDDVDLFLEPTQSFLPPADQGSPQGWDPEEPTQLFCPPQEEEEEEEEPPQPPPPAPPKEGTKEEGPRRSHRLARSRGGGAKGGVASAEEGGGGRGCPWPASLRRSPRLLARHLAEPRPPPAKPRPRRARTSQSRRRAQDKEEEPIEVEAPQLRPRRSLGSSPPKVLFTGLVASKAMEVALGSLGGSVATSVFDCIHLVTDRIRRTLKFLCAVARGVPIVTPEWLHQSATSGRVLAPGPFLVQDRQQEQHFGFSLAQALQRARRHPLLQGYEIHVTPSVRPEPEHMKDIITCSGGTFLPTMPSTYRPRCVVVSCPADAWCWAPALSSRLPLASPELLLTGLLRQRLQLQPFLLPPPTENPPPNRGPPSTRRRPVGPPQ
ncbi:LOW QUALITY PROTEIN: basic proline-rich protein-like [Lathamus discolor]|uniref:LOW QUALITY PROTEIN: basic proline-rich protein-like n=1 Tax=Lathamus discolor TaxID=678569 RepID=UPI0032B739F2